MITLAYRRRSCVCQGGGAVLHGGVAGAVPALPLHPVLAAALRTTGRRLDGVRPNTLTGQAAQLLISLHPFRIVFLTCFRTCEYV